MGPQILRVPVPRRLLSGLHTGLMIGPLVRVREMGVVEAKGVVVMHKALVTGATAHPFIATEPLTAPGPQRPHIPVH